MTRVFLLKTRYGLRALFLIRAGMLMAFGAAIVPAEADNGSLYVAPGPSSLISADIVRRNQDQLQLGGSGRKLGDLIGSSLKSPAGNATALVVTTKCGHYISAMITYPDGSAAGERARPLLIRFRYFATRAQSFGCTQNCRSTYPALRIRLRSSRLRSAALFMAVIIGG
jgi:hypothetical protein